ncbi:transposase, partial [Novosphingobium sp. Rr 2-17]|uniref:transposase n=1 Tax=Novosphingobium sp. Rr 2-17 TaxID=555793 RepID=UPI000269A57D
MADLDLHRVVAALVERCDRLEEKVEHLTAQNAALKDENQALKDEIAHLKGLPPRPKFNKSKPSGMEKATAPSGKARRKRTRGAVKSKLTISREVTLKATVPVGSRFKGYEDVLVQDLRISVEVVRYRRERWQERMGTASSRRCPSALSAG